MTEPHLKQGVDYDVKDGKYYVRRGDKLGKPTSHLRFVNGKLQQLWTGEEQRWSEDERSTFPKWEEWREVEGQELRTDGDENGARPGR